MIRSFDILLHVSSFDPWQQAWRDEDIIQPRTVVGSPEVDEENSAAFCRNRFSVTNLASILVSQSMNVNEFQQSEKCGHEKENIYEKTYRSSSDEVDDKHRSKARLLW